MHHRGVGLLDVDSVHQKDCEKKKSLIRGNENEVSLLTLNLSYLLKVFFTGTAYLLTCNLI